jgi:cell division protein FtsW (lipid II flippase)
MLSFAIALLQAVARTASTTASGSPRRLAFVPEPHTDFIFSVSREEFSILRLGITLLVLFVLIRYIRRRRTGSNSLDE